MQCELCGKDIRTFDEWFPVLTYQDSPFETEVWPYRKGVHLDCIKEMLDALRAATLALAPGTENQAPTGESNGT